MKPPALSTDMLARIDAYWRAANYLSVGQIYLRDNPLLKRPLALADVKRMLLGHWGTTPGQNFIYAHLNRVIRQYDLDMIYISGPGHGGPAVVANTYLEGSYSEVYPDIGRDEAGLRRLFRQFSFPGGIPSHASPECPGSIHEGGELGYSLSHAFGAVFDNPELVVACVIGDGEAETGPLATAWHSNKFLDPVTDGAVLPILHLNGYKIANPTVLGRMSDEEVTSLFVGYGYEPIFVEGADPMRRLPSGASAASSGLSRPCASNSSCGRSLRSQSSSICRCSGCAAGSDSGTWCERKLPSIGRPSITFGPVQPLGESSTIIGQRGRAVLPLARASRWKALICSTAVSSAAAIAACIGAGSWPATNSGVQP